MDMVDDMVDNVEDGISALFSESVLTVVLGCVERPPGCVKPPPRVRGAPHRNCGEVSMCVLVWGRVCVCGVVWVWCVGRWCGVRARTCTVQSQSLRSHVNFKPH